MWMRGVSGEKGPAVAASYLFVVFFNILRIERLVVSKEKNSEEGWWGGQGKKVRKKR